MTAIKLKAETPATIDATPNWEQSVRMLLVVHREGTFEGIKMAEEELLRMGRLLDQVATEQRKEAS